MTDAMVPLSASVRMSDADYPGVVASIAPGWRLSVSMDGKRYCLQCLADTDAGSFWVPAGGRSPSTLPRIVSKYADEIEGLSALCADLPADPSAALPLFVARARAMQSNFQLTDYRRNDYPGEVARDGSLRLVVGPCRSVYRLQWVAKRHIESGTHWDTVFKGPSLSAVRAFALENVYSIEGSGPQGRVTGDGVLARWQAFCAGLPELPGDNALPGLPAVPS